jgi:hypothetical protein
MAYRRSRNIEASLIDYFRTALFDDKWEGITVEKSIKQDELNPPTILINVVDTDVKKLEIGSASTLKFPTVYIRIFADNDGQRLDLADWALDKLEGDIPYYQYSIFDGKVASKDEAGNLVVLQITRDEKELFNTDPTFLSKEDRYRHLIAFTCYVGETNDC